MKKICLAVLIIPILILTVSFTGCSANRITYKSEEESYFYFEYRANQDYDSFSFEIQIAQTPDRFISGVGYNSFVTDKLSNFPALKKGEVVGLKVGKNYNIITANELEKITIEKSDLQKIKIIGIRDGKEISYVQAV